jgi:hypothetical protein
MHLLLRGAGTAGSSGAAEALVATALRGFGTSGTGASAVLDLLTALYGAGTSGTAGWAVLSATPIATGPAIIIPVEYARQVIQQVIEDVK